MKTLRTASGFTLVEAIVAGSIGAVLSLVFIAIAGIHNSTVNEGYAKGKTMRVSDVFSSEVARSIRSGSTVMAPDEQWSENPSLQNRVVDTILMYRPDGTVIAAFARSGTADKTLSTGSNVGTLAPFRSGHDTAFARAGSGFILSADRKSVILDLEFTQIYKSKTYSVPAKKDRFRCRN